MLYFVYFLLYSIMLIILLLVLTIINFILTNICDIILNKIHDISLLEKQTKYAIMIQRQYKKKKFIKKFECMIPLIKEIYYMPDMKGFFICKKRFLKMQQMY